MANIARTNVIPEPQWLPSATNARGAQMKNKMLTLDPNRKGRSPTGPLNAHPKQQQSRARQFPDLADMVYFGKSPLKHQVTTSPTEPYSRILEYLAGYQGRAMKLWKILTHSLTHSFASELTEFDFQTESLLDGNHEFRRKFVVVFESFDQSASSVLDTMERRKRMYYPSKIQRSSLASIEEM